MSIWDLFDNRKRQQPGPPRLPITLGPPPIERQVQTFAGPTLEDILARGQGPALDTRTKLQAPIDINLPSYDGDYVLDGNPSSRARQAARNAPSSGSALASGIANAIPAVVNAFRTAPVMPESPHVPAPPSLPPSLPPSDHGVPDPGSPDPMQPSPVVSSRPLVLGERSEASVPGEYVPMGESSGRLSAPAGSLAGSQPVVLSGDGPPRLKQYGEPRAPVEGYRTLTAGEQQRLISQGRPDLADAEWHADTKKWAIGTGQRVGADQVDQSLRNSADNSQQQWQRAKYADLNDSLQLQQAMGDRARTEAPAIRPLDSADRASYERMLGTSKMTPEMRSAIEGRLRADTELSSLNNAQTPSHIEAARSVEPSEANAYETLPPNATPFHIPGVTAPAPNIPTLPPPVEPDILPPPAGGSPGTPPRPELPSNPRTRPFDPIFNPPSRENMPGNTPEEKERAWQAWLTDPANKPTNKVNPITGKAGFKGRLKDALMAALFAAVQQVGANGGVADWGTLGAAMGGGAGGAIRPQWNEELQRQQDIGQSRIRLGEYERQGRADLETQGARARIDLIRKQVDNYDADNARADAAQKAAAEIQKRNADIRQAQLDFKRLSTTKKINGVEYSWDPAAGAWKPAKGLPVSEKDRPVEVLVKVPDGDGGYKYEKFMVPQSKVAGFGLEMEKKGLSAELAAAKQEDAQAHAIRLAEIKRLHAEVKVRLVAAEKEIAAEKNAKRRKELEEYKSQLKEREIRLKAELGVDEPEEEEEATNSPPLQAKGEAIPKP